MAELTLSKETIKMLLHGDSQEPRSVFGFHEVSQRNKQLSILNTAGSGKFSSDRTIAEYAKDIWGLEAVTVELQGKIVS